MFENSSADYRQWHTYSNDRKKRYGQPFTYSKIEFDIPQHGGTWFMATAYANHGGELADDPTLLVFEKTGGAGWKLMAAVRHARRPDIAGQRGLAIEAAATAKSGPLAPKDIAAAFEDLYATGGKRAGAVLARGDPAARAALGVYRDRDKELGPKGRQKRFSPAAPTHPKIYALKTTDGVLAVIPLAHTQEVMAVRPGLQVDPSPVDRLYGAVSGPVVTTELGGQAVAHLPTSGSPRILGFEYSVIGAH